MAWSAFPTWVVGQVSTAADWNTYVANNMQFLAVPPAGRIIGAATTIQTSYVYAQIAYGSTDFLTGGMTTSLSVVQLTVPVVGKYWVNAVIGSMNGAANATVTGPVQCAIYYNGALSGAGSRKVQVFANASWPYAAYCGPSNLLAGDTIALYCAQNLTLGGNAFADPSNGNVISHELGAIKVSN